VVTGVGVLALLASVSFVLCALAEAARSGRRESSTSRAWPLLTATAFLSGCSALVLSRLDPEADEPFCRAWAVVAFVTASVSAFGWVRHERITGERVALAGLGIYLVSRVAGRAFAVS